MKRNNKLNYYLRIYIYILFLSNDETHFFIESVENCFIIKKNNNYFLYPSPEKLNLLFLEKLFVII